MKIVVDGHKFDTTKAKKHYKLSYWNSHNWINGNLWISSKNVFYMEEPTRWSNYAGNYRMTSPIEILSTYREYLNETEIEEIAKYIDDWE